MNSGRLLKATDKRARSAWCPEESRLRRGRRCGAPVFFNVSGRLFIEKEVSARHKPAVQWVDFLP